MKTKMTAAVVVVGAVVSMMLAGCGGVAVKDMRGQGGMDAYNLTEGKITPNPKLVIDAKLNKSSLGSLSNIRNITRTVGESKIFDGSIATLVDVDNQIMSAFIPLCFTAHDKKQKRSRLEKKNAVTEVVNNGYMYGIHYIYDGKTGLLATDSGVETNTKYALPITTCKLASEFNFNSPSNGKEKNKIENIYRINILSVSPDNQKVIGEFMNKSFTQSSDENYQQFVASILPILNSEKVSKKNQQTEEKLMKTLDSDDAGSDELWAEVDSAIASSVANPNVPVLKNSSGQAIASKKHWSSLDKVSSITNHRDGTIIGADGLTMMYAMYKLPMILRTDEITRAISYGLSGGN